MKNISRILAIYILVLAIMPCNDIHANVQNTSNVSVISQEEGHHHFDFCSPFCSCDCCQTIAEPIVFDVHQIEKEAEHITVFHFFILEKENIYTFWRPPIF